MTEPTRQMIITAHEALENLETVIWAEVKDFDDLHLSELCMSQIRAALPPKPAPTMAEVEWNEEKHGLAEATHAEFGRVIMVKQSLGGDEIGIVYKQEDEAFYELVSPDTLTPIES